MMVVFRAALPITMAVSGIIVTTSQAAVQRNPIIMQKLPSGFDLCKDLEEDQRTAIEKRYCTLHILNTLNLLKRVDISLDTEERESYENITPSMNRNHLDMHDKHMKVVPQMEAP